MIVERIKESQPGTRLAGRTRGAHSLDYQNWVKADLVRVSFNIHHDGSAILLQYFVQENHVRAVNTEYNSPVWEDSCVEFFLSLEGDEENYYNFEFNAIGTVLGAYGKNRNERSWLPSSVLKKIEVLPSLGHEPLADIEKPTSWSILIRIPAEAFAFSDLKELSGKDGYANFYKCGDKLNQPHYLSWKPVLVPDPDFHLPRYFGQLSFL